MVGLTVRLATSWQEQLWSVGSARIHNARIHNVCRLFSIAEAHRSIDGFSWRWLMTTQLARGADDSRCHESQHRRSERMAPREQARNTIAECKQVSCQNPNNYLSPKPRQDQSMVDRHVHNQSRCRDDHASRHYNTSLRIHDRKQNGNALSSAKIPVKYCSEFTKRPTNHF